MRAHVDSMPCDFHDSSLLDASRLGSTIKLTIEYLSEDDVEFSASVIIRDVKEILRNDLPIPEFKMETNYGSIFSPQSDTMTNYKMLGAII